MAWSKTSSPPLLQGRLGGSRKRVKTGLKDNLPCPSLVRRGERKGSSPFYKGRLGGVGKRVKNRIEKETLPGPSLVRRGKMKAPPFIRGGREG